MPAAVPFPVLRRINLGCSEVPVGRIRPGRAVWLKNARKKPELHDRLHADACARNRREYGDIQLC